MKLVPNRDKQYQFCEWIATEEGNAKLVRDAYGKAAHKLKFSDGKAFKRLIISILELAARRERLGSIKVDSIPVVNRSIPISAMSISEIFARFAFTQRALGALLTIAVMEFNPLIYGEMQDKNVCLAVNDPYEICEFLISFLQTYSKYGHEDELLEQLQKHLASRISI